MHFRFLLSVLTCHFVSLTLMLLLHSTVSGMASGRRFWAVNVYAAAGGGARTGAHGSFSGSC